MEDRVWTTDEDLEADMDDMKASDNRALGVDLDLHHVLSIQVTKKCVIKRILFPVMNKRTELDRR